MKRAQIVDQQTWLQKRLELLRAEKELTRLRDQLNAERRAMPWVQVEKDYRFQTEQGEQSLPELFAGRSQLVIQHFMYGPDWAEGCPSCSFWADNFSGTVVHLNHRDISFVAISRAPLDQLLAYRRRMGWEFPWASSLDSDFNFDFQASFSDEELAAGEVYYNFRNGTFPSSEAPGVSVFAKDANDNVFHTYSCYGRGLDILNGTYHYMDLTPKGRDEAQLPWPMAWLRRHDQYED
ncbi:MAG TPA: DUF899 domain-containing protein [Gammaproteobacteria bacterium]|nr:DUF899 domain-containing protein [Gammaproteobacteria bacterium]